MGRYRHPWDFGITPSQYIRSMNKPNHYIEEAVTALGRDRYAEGLDRLDDLYRHTLECPPLRKFGPEMRSAIESLGTKDALLTASYARPACYFFSLDMKKAKRFFAAMGKAGLGKLHLAELDKDFDMPTGDPVIDNKGTLIMSFNDGINEECVGITRAVNKKRMPASAYHLVMGTAFGFPVGDVVESSAGSAAQMIFQDDVLSHFITPWDWSRKWGDKVGLDGEVRLARIYKEVLGLDAQK